MGVVAGERLGLRFKHLVAEDGWVVREMEAKGSRVSVEVLESNRAEEGNLEDASGVVSLAESHAEEGNLESASRTRMYGDERRIQFSDFEASRWIMLLTSSSLTSLNLSKPKH